MKGAAKTTKKRKRKYPCTFVDGMLTRVRDGVRLIPIDSSIMRKHLKSIERSGRLTKHLPKTEKKVRKKSAYNEFVGTWMKANKGGDTGGVPLMKLAAAAWRARGE